MCGSVVDVRKKVLAICHLCGALSSPSNHGLLRLGTGVADLLFLAVFALVAGQLAVGMGTVLVAEHFGSRCISRLDDRHRGILPPHAAGGADAEPGSAARGVSAA